MAFLETSGLKALVWAGVIGALAASGPARGEGNAEKGEALAVERCAQCHVIGAQNPHGGVSNSPSFYIFAEKPEVYMERLQSFYERRPPQGPGDGGHGPGPGAHHDLRAHPETAEEVTRGKTEL